MQRVARSKGIILGISISTNMANISNPIRSGEVATSMAVSPASLISFLKPSALLKDGALDMLAKNFLNTKLKEKLVTVPRRSMSLRKY